MYCQLDACIGHVFMLPKVQFRSYLPTFLHLSLLSRLQCAHIRQAILLLFLLHCESKQMHWYLVDIINPFLALFIIFYVYAPGLIRTALTHSTQQKPCLRSVAQRESLSWCCCLCRGVT